MHIVTGWCQDRDKLVTRLCQAGDTAMVAHLWSAFGSQLTVLSHGDQILLVGGRRGNM